MDQFDKNCSIAVVWEEVLPGVFPLIGRMARLAECHDRQTGQYRHEKVTARLGADQAHSALRRTHALVWRDWLSGAFPAQQADLAIYLRTLPQSMDVIIPIWRDTQPFVRYVPMGATESERNLFITTVNTLLKLFLYYWTPNQGIANSDAASLASSLPTRALRMVQDRYADSSLSLQSLSKTLHVSQDHLGRTLKTHTGQTFRECLRSIRIREAARLLRSSDCAIKEIAAMVGYNDPSHFVRYFHAEVGSTPSEFRKQGRGGPVQDLAITRPDLA